MKRFKNSVEDFDLMEADPDGVWVRYEDHVEAMKRIAGDGAQQAEPYNAYQRDWEKVVRCVKFQSETFPELASMSPEGAISWLVVELAARHEKFAEPSATPPAAGD